MTSTKAIQIVLNELETRSGTLSVADAAQLVNRSERSFRRDFARNVGVTFRVARLHAKLEKGELLLRTTGLCISEISAQLGYSDRTKFEKAFKRCYGTTPTHFRLWLNIRR
jgi:AraC family transcriptional regulator, transcriptional activator FtrA